MVQVNITKLIDEVQCYQTVRELRWPDGVACPSCESTHVIKRGCDDTEPARQRYECHDCDQRFDDLTDTIFAGHHQPLKVWVLCLYFMGLNLSNEQIGQELALNGSDVQQMTAQLRAGIVKKTRVAKLAGVSSLQASQDMMRDHGESADAESAAGGGSLVPAAALARP
jgi:transposase-like protein